jgi:hypothetical protein
MVTGSLLFLVSLWEVYIAGIRVLDLMAVVLAAVTWMRSRSDPLEGSPVAGFMLIAVVLLIHSTRGILASPEAIKPALGLILGVAVAIFLVGTKHPAGPMAKILKALIVANIAAFLLQLFVYYGTGRILNYYAFIGLEPRLMSWFFRPAGLYLEPSSYAIMLLALLTLYRFSGGRSLWLDLLSVATMFLSISLWAFVAAGLYIAMFRPWVALWAVVGGAMFGGFILSLGVIDPFILEWILKRVSNPTADGSAMSRYSGLIALLDRTEFESWFGRGVSNDFLATGSSSASFIINATGIIGTLAITCVWLLILPAGRRLKAGLVFALMLLAAPLWTAVWWWVWLALAVAIALPAGSPRDCQPARRTGS